MIADLDETLQKLLKNELPIKNGEIDIKFEQPKREWSARLSKPTINFFLYDLRENVKLRAQHRERVMQKARNGRDRQVHMKRTPYRMDCYYLITTWAVEPEDEHNLLSACVTALLRHPSLPPEYLIGELEEQPYSIHSKLASPDVLPNVSEVWSVLDNEMRPAVTCVLTISIDPWEVETMQMVESVSLTTGEARIENRDARTLKEGTTRTTYSIGGTVYLDKSKTETVSNIEVAIKGTGHFTQTNLDGRFQFSTLGDGKLTLVAWRPNGTVVQKEVSIPGDEEDYNLFI
ncbi:MAG: Pvc16 family protein [Candidatus Promineifilaceae bacterium]